MSIHFYCKKNSLQKASDEKNTKPNLSSGKLSSTLTQRLSLAIFHLFSRVFPRIVCCRIFRSVVWVTAIIFTKHFIANTTGFIHSRDSKETRLLFSRLFENSWLLKFKFLKFIVLNIRKKRKWFSFIGHECHVFRIWRKKVSCAAKKCPVNMTEELKIQ